MFIHSYPKENCHFSTEELSRRLEQKRSTESAFALIFIMKAYKKLNWIWYNPKHTIVPFNCMVIYHIKHSSKLNLLVHLINWTFSTSSHISLPSVPLSPKEKTDQFIHYWLLIQDNSLSFPMPVYGCSYLLKKPKSRNNPAVGGWKIFLTEITS